MQHKNQPFKGKLCCCHGEDECNTKMTWGTPSTTLDALKAKQKAKGAPRPAAPVAVLILLASWVL